MPETYWTVRWPDGEEERLYSPSSVVAELFEPGRAYPVPDFLQRARVAMERASDRVQRKYGFACTSAMAQLDAVERRVETLPPEASVTCLKISQ
ncbi:MSMEG_0570 family nitrogen starvation response protein [Rhodobacterales bacterium HKCCE2091]|nr:MSMEG_0570 family nitrogen starvation response protein [Rhodobacterales bacterium HKCCE2091]